MLQVLRAPVAILAAGFFVTSLVLSWLASYDRKPASILNTSPAPISQPGAPAAPAGGLLDSLKKPEAPSAPQAPQSK